jgi:hypothetical protein
MHIIIAPNSLPLQQMAGHEMADLDTSRDDEDAVSHQEMGVDIGGEQGLGDRAKQNSETASQLGTDETDGKGTKKRKKAAQRIIQDGESLYRMQGCSLAATFLWICEC